MMNGEFGNPFFPTDAYLELTSGSEELAAIMLGAEESRSLLEMLGR